MSINPVLLSISPSHLEQQFWAQAHITAQLLNIDRFAFIVSTLNIYSGWNTARMVHTAPVVSAVLAALCPLFILLTVAQQLVMKRSPSWYLQHRESILLVTRIVRGGWMVAAMAVTNEADICSSFVARRLAAGMAPQLVVLQLLMLFTLILLGQCLYWPLHFKHALPLQTVYVFTSLAAMRSVKCVLGSPGVAAGARALCYKVQMMVNCLTVLLTEGQLSCLVPVGDDAAAAAVLDPQAVAGKNTAVAGARGCSSSSSSSSASCGLSSLCSWRSNEEVLFFWLVVFGLLLPLYIMYVRELSCKQRFLRALLRQQQQQTLAPASDVSTAAGTHQQQQQQQQLSRQLAVAAGGADSAFVGGVLLIGPLLHCAAVSILVMIGSVITELLLLALRPPVCA